MYDTTRRIAVDLITFRRSERGICAQQATGRGGCEGSSGWRWQRYYLAMEMDFRVPLFVCGLTPAASLAQVACDTLLVVDFVVSVEGYTATFTDLTSNDLSDVHYWWDYGDGIVEHLGGYQHTYADTGSYSACLSVFEPDGWRCWRGP